MTESKQGWGCWNSFGQWRCSCHSWPWLQMFGQPAEVCLDSSLAAAGSGHGTLLFSLPGTQEGFSSSDPKGIAEGTENRRYRMFALKFFWIMLACLCGSWLATW